MVWNSASPNLEDQTPRREQLRRSRLNNGPYRQTHTEQEETAAWDEEKTRLHEACRKRGIFNASSGETKYLKLISEAGAKLKKCTVPSMPCVPRKVCMETFACSGKPEALKVSKSARAWDFKKVEPKSEAVHKAEKDGRLVQFASLMDLCNISNTPSL